MQESEPVSDPAPRSGPLARAMRTTRGSCGGRTKLPPGKCWAPHDGYNARFRRHRQVWVQFEKLCRSDGYAKVTRERLLDYVAELRLTQSASELMAMSLALKAKVKADEVRSTWTAAINALLNALEAAKVDPSVGVVVKPCAPAE